MPHEITQSGTPDNWHVIEDGDFPNGVEIVKQSYITVRGCDITNPAGHGIHVCDNTHHITLEDNQIHDCAGAGISIHGVMAGQDFFDAQIIVRWNPIERCMGWGIEVNGEERGAELRGVVIGGNDVSLTRPLGEAAGYGIYLCFTAECVVWGNKSHHNAYSGIHLDGHAPTAFGCSWCDIRENECFNNVGPGVEVEVSQHNGVGNNRIWSDAGSGWRNHGILVGDQSSDNTISWNTIYSNLGGPVICIENRSPGTQVLHNTIVAPGLSIQLDDAEATKNCVVANNILRRIYNETALDTTYVEEFNHFLTGASGVFVDPAAHDYRLRPGSPCIGAGEGGSDIGAIPYKEEKDVFTVSKQVTFTKHFAVVEDEAGFALLFECDGTGGVAENTPAFAQVSLGADKELEAIQL